MESEKHHLIHLVNLLEIKISSESIVNISYSFRLFSITFLFVLSDIVFRITQWYKRDRGEHSRQLFSQIKNRRDLGRGVSDSEEFLRCGVGFELGKDCEREG